jgi:heat shock protein HslJ
MERLVRAALAATLSILLVAGGTLAVTQSSTEIDTLQGGTWTLTELDGQPVRVDAGITATFGADETLSGSGGCNRYSGSYLVEGSDIAVGALATTRMACEADVMDVEDEFLDLLQASTTWSVNGPTLILSTPDGADLVFGGEASADASFTGTAWTLDSISGELVDPSLGVTAIFSEDFTVAGFAGCNQYSGGYSVDEDAIAIGPLAATRKACAPEVMDVEAAFLDGMEAAEVWTVAGDVLILEAADGQLAFVAGGAGTLTGVEWTLVDLDGEPISPDRGIALTFGTDFTLSGSGGCNSLNGSYAVDGSEIVIGPVGSTMMACEQDVMDLESDFVSVLSDVATWQIADGMLTLTANDGATLTFEGSAGPSPTPRPAGDLVGPVWVLSDLNGAPIPTAIITVTISFSADGTVSGNGGCNDYSGTYTVDGSSISISDIGSTKRSCDPASDQVEQGVLMILPFLDSYEVQGDELHLDSSLGVQSVWTRE